MIFRLLIFTILPLLIILEASNERSLQMMKVEQRIALVIGNNTYKSDRLAKLKNPINDARAMREKLQTLGFRVYYGEDLSVREMDKKLRDFATKLRAGGVGLFFFAGHGVEFQGRNYLMGKDSNLAQKDEIAYESLELNKVLDKMQNSGNRLNIVLLDACRNDPFSRSGGGGLAKSTAKGTYIAYATSPGDVASDGDGKNGVFTSEILKYIDAPGVPIERIFKNVKLGVLTKTNNMQRPWVSNDIVGDFFFRLHNEVALKDSIKYEKNTLDIPKNFVLIKAGSFEMGSNSGADNEKPLHRVDIDYDFCIAKYEVTYNEYDEFTKQTGRKMLRSSMFDRGEKPVINVSWSNAKAYTDWLSKKTGKTYRLPTEAEWEYVARAGTTTKYNFGIHKSWLKNYAWYQDNADKKTHEVGQKEPNKFGVYDMYGNVWEWCEDWYRENYNAQASQEYKVIRGGSWYESDDEISSSLRARVKPNHSNDNFGFRVVMIP